MCFVHASKKLPKATYYGCHLFSTLSITGGKINIFWVTFENSDQYLFYMHLGRKPRKYQFFGTIPNNLDHCVFSMLLPRKPRNCLPGSFVLSSKYWFLPTASDTVTLLCHRRSMQQLSSFSLSPSPQICRSTCDVVGLNPRCCHVFAKMYKAFKKYISNKHAAAFIFSPSLPLFQKFKDLLGILWVETPDASIFLLVLNAFSKK